jgi:hypothetical protein
MASDSNSPDPVSNAADEEFLTDTEVLNFIDSSGLQFYWNDQYAKGPQDMVG